MSDADKAEREIRSAIALLWARWERIKGEPSSEWPQWLNLNIPIVKDDKPRIRGEWC